MQKKNLTIPINIIVEYSDGQLSEFKLLINFKEKKAKLLACVREINVSEKDFNAVAQIAFIPLPPIRSDAKAICADVSSRAKVIEQERYFAE